MAVLTTIGDGLVRFGKSQKGLGRTVAVLADLQGPKIRIARFKDESVMLRAGTRFVLDADLGSDDGDEIQVGLDYQELPNDCRKGDVLLVDDDE